MPVRMRMRAGKDAHVCIGNHCTRASGRSRRAWRIERGRSREGWRRREVRAVDKGFEVIDDVLHVLHVFLYVRR
jgi:hypothetical protein